MAETPPPPPAPAALQPDGSLKVERIGLEREIWSDLFHTALTLSWGQLALFIVAGFLLLNTGFAGLYLVGGENIANAAPGSFLDAFAFSIQTFATIGYGVFAPQSSWAHGLVAVESVVAILFNALATGLFFAKFARPTAKVIFAEVATICLHEGLPTLQLQCANGRHNQLVEASFKLRISRIVRTPEGQSMRRLYDLPLLRESNPIFALSWTLFHPITRESPLYGQTPESLAASQTMLIGVLTGIDDTMAQVVHARSIWFWDKILFHRRHVDIMRADLGTGDAVIDYTRFHETVDCPEERPAG